MMTPGIVSSPVNQSPKMRPTPRFVAYGPRAVARCAMAEVILRYWFGSPNSVCLHNAIVNLLPATPLSCGIGPVLNTGLLMESSRNASPCGGLSTKSRTRWASPKEWNVLSSAAGSTRLHSFFVGATSAPRAATAFDSESVMSGLTNGSFEFQEMRSPIPHLRFGSTRCCRRRPSSIHFGGLWRMTGLRTAITGSDTLTKRTSVTTAVVLARPVSTASGASSSPLPRPWPPRLSSVWPRPESSTLLSPSSPSPPSRRFRWSDSPGLH